MNTTVNTAHENFINLQKRIDVLSAEESAIRVRITSAMKVRTEFTAARNAMEAAKHMRREALGKIHLSGKADSAKAELAVADKALLAASHLAEQLSDSATGASHALERLEIDQKLLREQLSELRNQSPAMQLAAATEAAESIFERYVAAGDELESSLASVIGTLQTLEFMRHSDKPLTANGRAFYLWNELYPCALELPNIPFLQERFTAFRPHARVAELAAAQREHFTSHLNTLGII
jgi:chromosome segregation ATPase